MKIYLAGPMRGIPEFNFPAFDEAARRGRALGHTIISPAEMDRQVGFNEKGQSGQVDSRGLSETVTPTFARDCAYRDVAAILGKQLRVKAFDGALTNTYLGGVDAVAMLPGWENSRGAKAEKGLAEWVGLDILDATTFGPLHAPFLKVKNTGNGRRVFVGHMMQQAAAELGRSSGVPDQPNSTNPKDAIGRTKPPLHLIPPSATIEEAVVMGLGAQKYGPYNWRGKTVAASVYIGAALRHLASWYDGESADPESGASHLAHARACLGILLDAQATENLVDDRPPAGKAPALIAQYTKRKSA